MLVMHVIADLGASGGAEASLFQLAKNNKHDKQIVVSLREHGDYGSRLEALGIEVHSLHMRRGRISFAGVKVLFLLIRRLRPDVIQTWMYHSDLFAGIVARLALNNSVCWGIHHSNLDPRANSEALMWVVKACAIFSWIVPKKIISCSVRSMEIHQQNRYRRGIFTVVPNGYDIERFVFDADKRQQLRQSLDVKGEILLGMVGRWHPQKDHEVLIKALVLVNEALDENICCLLVGEEMKSDNTELMSVLSSSNAAAYFKLIGETDDVPAVMSAIDIHVLSSRGEAFPNVVAEAMACQTPCVVTDVGDAALIVDETGWVVPPRSPEALAKGIISAVEAVKVEQTWHDRRASCRARIVDNYEISEVVQLYRNVWQEI